MADRTLQILPGGQSPAPFTYVVPASTSFTLLGVEATFDGSAAAGDFVPCVQLVSDAGVVMAFGLGESVTAGGSAAVTFAPFLRKNTATASGGIRFNVDNEGGWFLLGGNVSIPSGPLAPAAVGLYDSGAGGGVGFWDGNFGGGITMITGPKAPWSFGFGGIQLLSNQGGVTVYASQPTTIDSDTFTHVGSEGVTEVVGGAGVTIKPDPHALGSLLTIPGLPIVDPGFSGAIWNNAGFLAISP